MNVFAYAARAPLKISVSQRVISKKKDDDKLKRGNEHAWRKDDK